MTKNAKKHDKDEIEDFLENFNKDKLNFNLDAWVIKITGKTYKKRLSLNKNECQTKEIIKEENIKKVKNAIESISNNKINQ